LRKSKEEENFNKSMGVLANEMNIYIRATLPQCKHLHIEKHGYWKHITKSVCAAELFCLDCKQFIGFVCRKQGFKQQVSEYTIMQYAANKNHYAVKT
jgi:hypothetical protein